MATALDYSRLRRDVGASITVLPDVDAELIFVEAAETHTGAASQAAYARILFIRGLVSSASRMASYRQNNSSEEASDVFAHLMQLLAYWEKKLAEAIEGEDIITPTGINPPPSHTIRLRAVF